MIILALLAGCLGREVALEETAPWLDASVRRRISEPELDPALLIPADARWYVRLDGLTEWFNETSGDPLVRHLWSVIRSFQPPELWKRGAQHLGISDQEMIATYFGRTVALVDQKIGDRHGVVVMTRAADADLRKLPEALQLKPLQAMHRFGPFTIWSAAEGQKEFVLAIGHRWLMITEAPLADHVRRLAGAVASGVPALSDHRELNGLLEQLPRRRDAIVLVHDPGQPSAGDDYHALTVGREGQAVTVDYIAQTPELFEYLRDVEEAPGVDFASLPDSVITAVSINILQHSPPGAGALNMFLFPRNFKKHVRPGIAPPILAFLASMPPDRIDPDPGVSVPVLGLAIRLTDPAVADELDRIVKGLHFVLSAARLDLAKGLFGVSRVRHNGLDYHIADFGPILQNRVEDENVRRLTNLPSSAGLTKLTFGRVGDFYLICSQESFLHDWARAYADRSLRLSAMPAYEMLDLESRPHLVASFLTRAPQLGALLRDVAEYWRKAQESRPRPQEEPTPPAVAAEKARKADPPPQREDRIEQPLRWIAEGLQHRRSFSLQVWRDGQQRLYGRLRIVPPESTPAAPPDPGDPQPSGAAEAG